MRTTCPLEPSRVGVFNVAMCHVNRGTGKVRVAVLRFNYPASPSAVNLILVSVSCYALSAVNTQFTQTGTMNCRVAQLCRLQRSPSRGILYMYKVQPYVNAESAQTRH